MICFCFLCSRYHGNDVYGCPSNRPNTEVQNKRKEFSIVSKQEHFASMVFHHTRKTLRQKKKKKKKNLGKRRRVWRRNNICSHADGGGEWVPNLYPLMSVFIPDCVIYSARKLSVTNLFDVLAWMLKAIPALPWRIIHLSLHVYNPDVIKQGLFAHYKKPGHFQQVTAGSLEKVKCRNIHRTQAVKTASDRNVLADKEEPVCLSADKATQSPEGRPPQRHQDVHPAAWKVNWHVLKAAGRWKDDSNKGSVVRLDTRRAGIIW